MSPTTAAAATQSITELYRAVREQTMGIVAPLEIEDYVIQTAEFMSPPRWHIGHTSWFFETVLQSFKPDYKPYSNDFLFYFNSYYEGFGARVERARRGTRSRPTVRETVAYRKRIDDLMLEFLHSLDSYAEAEKIQQLVRLGLEHEMQHQELLVYDIKHLLCDLYQPEIKPAQPARTKVTGMAEIEGGLFELGYDTRKNGFAFDNEKPAHKVFLQDFALDRGLVTNSDFLQFIRDNGYGDYRWWFSEGWEAINREHWRAPMYWEEHDGQWFIRGYRGLHPAEQQGDLPVSHVSYFEASAYAKWAGKRLPTEAEWEKAASFSKSQDQKQDYPWGNEPPKENLSNLFENSYWDVAPSGAFPDGQSQYGCHQMIGDVWEWTTSDYVPYPDFKSEFDEYNDKWFVNQKVLRGGSYATPKVHIRSTYRNFFHAHERWMVSGFRCAKDV
jgi:ergothioneine biosynthesis protein EgtB